MAENINHLISELSNPTPGTKSMICSILLQCTMKLLRSKRLADDRSLRWMDALTDEKLWIAPSDAGRSQTPPYG